mmetsp:Transcript_27706/g.41937  ORF Transcript_27706/g.41937 Transcript_27706/m.41937 type:complete len:105 (-) Transcript_27706:281-595(-)
MNFNSNINQSYSSMEPCFHHSMEQSHLRVESPSLSIFRKFVVNENPVPEPQRRNEIISTHEKAMMNLSLNQWEGQSEPGRHSSQQRLMLPNQRFKLQISIAKVA